jgi:hypothetical protein
MEKKQLNEDQIASRLASQMKYRTVNREKYLENQNKYTKEWYQKNKNVICQKKRNAYVSKKKSKNDNTETLMKI